MTSCRNNDPVEQPKPVVPSKPEEPKPDPTPTPTPTPEPEPEKRPIDMSWLNTYNANWWRGKASEITIAASDLREADPTKPEEQFLAGVYNYSACMYSGVPNYFGVGLRFPLCEDNARKAGKLAFVFLDAQRNVIGNTYTWDYNPANGYAQQKDLYTTMDMTPGSYFAVPVYRPQGEQKWILPSMLGSDARLPFEGLASLEPSRWGFEVKAIPQNYLTLYNLTDPDVTAILDDPNDHIVGHDGAFMFVDQGESFTSRYTICNPSGKAISGTLSYRDIRDFSLKHADALDLDACGIKALEWNREIGSCHIEIPAGTLVIEGTIDGVLSQPNYPACERYMGAQYLYFTPDGSSESYLIPMDERRLLSAYQGIPENQWSHYVQTQTLVCSYTQIWTNQKVNDVK